jgi:glycosyltransferase involved in cell wall biosynthesis
MKLSLIICTRNRADQLSQCLEKLDQVHAPPTPVEIVVIDNGSTDHTGAVIDASTRSSKWSIRTAFAEKAGLGHARNCGVEQSTGDLLAFTDDDCYLDPNYFVNLLNSFDRSFCQYGGGQILLFDSEDDPRIANLTFEGRLLIPPKTPVLPTGVIQGANMFFLREVFEKAGLFSVDMGAGTSFPCEDIEMACRASHSGFAGGQLPGFTVYHHHRRRKNSPEAIATIRSYDHGRGAYYASLLARGVPQAWSFWQNTFTSDGNIRSVEHLERLARELQSASQYFEKLADQIRKQ